MKLYVKKLNPNALIPKRATAQSAGYDISACLDKPLTINPGETKAVHTGISLEITDAPDCVLLLYARSSLATKHGLSPANCVGVVDTDYRGEIIVPLHNHGSEPYTIEPNERIAQLVITPILTPDIEEVKELSETLRGKGGFGSTGKL